MGAAIAQLDRIDALLVAVGHGPDPRSRRAAQRFCAAWCARDDRHRVATIVAWPADAASWLKPARRLTAHDVDAWVISDTPHPWGQMSRRLRASTPWNPGKTVALAGLNHPDTVPRAGPGILNGLIGGTASGELWFVQHDRLTHHTLSTPNATMNSLLPRTPAEIAPGAVHIPDWLDVQEQHGLVVACRAWAAGPAAIRHTRLPNGSTMSVQTVCLGWHWTPYRYTRTAIDQNNAPVTPFPDWLAELGRAALGDAYGDLTAGETYNPDVALVNFYDGHAKLGMHQD